MRFENYSFSQKIRPLSLSHEKYLTLHNHQKSHHFGCLMYRMNYISDVRKKMKVQNKSQCILSSVILSLSLSDIKMDLKPANLLGCKQYNISNFQSLDKT